MTKKNLLVFSLALLVVSVGGASGLLAPEPVALTTAPAVCPAAGQAASGATAAAPPSPGGCHQCRVDKNCDKYCGLNGGRCFQVNPGCFQCACYAP